jgi:flavin reductase (DIM6/NTAB) family NADH-FMN oxidoreductase RutF
MGAPARPDLGTFASLVDYPMYVVTVRARERQAGCLVGFATQTSITPPRFMVCISRANATAEIAADATHAAVHLLAGDGESGHDLAVLFGEESGDWTDKFSRCEWTPGPYDVPVLDGAAGWIVGEVVDRFDVGDHDAILLAPLDVREPRADGYLSFQDLRDLDPGHPT